jgi:hypothetical protein
MKGHQVFLLLTALAVVALVMTACRTTSTARETTTASAATITTASTAPVKPTPPAEGTFTDNRTPPSIDWSSAAAKLGISEQQLRQASGDSGQGMPDLAQTAATLGISEETLREAFGFPEGAPGGNPGNGSAPGNPPPGGFSPPTTPAAESGNSGG